MKRIAFFFPPILVACSGGAGSPTTATVEVPNTGFQARRAFLSDPDGVLIEETSVPPGGGKFTLPVGGSFSMDDADLGIVTAYILEDTKLEFHDARPSPRADLEVDAPPGWGGTGAWTVSSACASAPLAAQPFLDLGLYDDCPARSDVIASAPVGPDVWFSRVPDVAMAPGPAVSMPILQPSVPTTLHYHHLPADGVIVDTVITATLGGVPAGELYDLGVRRAGDQDVVAPVLDGIDGEVVTSTLHRADKYATTAVRFRRGGRLPVDIDAEVDPLPFLSAPSFDLATMTVHWNQPALSAEYVDAYLDLACGRVPSQWRVIAPAGANEVALPDLPKGFGSLASTRPDCTRINVTVGDLGAGYTQALAWTWQPHVALDVPFGDHARTTTVDGPQ